jgi:hypothetical protein
LAVALAGRNDDDFKVEASSCTKETITPAVSAPPVVDKLMEFAEFGIDRETDDGADELSNDDDDGGDPKEITEKLAVMPPVEIVTVFTVVDPEDVPAVNIPNNNGVRESKAFVA